MFTDYLKHATSYLVHFRRFLEFNIVPDTITNWYLSTELDRDFNGQTVYAINVRFRLDNPNDYAWVMNHIRMYFEDHDGDDFIREFPVEIIY